MASPTPQPIPYWLRAWRFTLAPKSGPSVAISSDQFDEPLRCTFNIEARAMLAYWTAELTIYNLNDTTKQQLQATGVPPWKFSQTVALGDILSISAGYKNSSSGPFNLDNNRIYRGAVFQPIWTRENVVDSKMTLRCLVGYLQDAVNLVNFSIGSGTTPYDVLRSIMKNAGIQEDQQPNSSQPSTDQQTLSQQSYNRGQALSGRPFDLIRPIAKDHKLQAWLSPTGLNVRSLKPDPKAIPQYTYGPPNLNGPYTVGGTTEGLVKKTLLGTPEQTQQGVIFRVELDAQPRIGDLVGLAPGTAINRLPYQIGQFPGILDQRGNYVISGIRHCGDTRGNDWYTELTTVSYNFFPDFLPTAPSVS